MKVMFICLSMSGQKGICIDSTGINVKKYIFLEKSVEKWKKVAL